MKKFMFLILVFLLVPTVFGIDLEISQASENVFIIGDPNPIEISFEIKNNGESSDFKIYNLIGFSMKKTEFSLRNGEKKKISFEVHPRNRMDPRENYAIEFFVKDELGEKVSAAALVKIVYPKDALEISISEIKPGDEEVTIQLKNLFNYKFEKIGLKFTSEFFSGQREVELGPYEEKGFGFRLNKKNIEKLPNGYYTVKTTIDSLGNIDEKELRVKFIEKGSLSTDTAKTGFLIRKETIQKTNTGNTKVRPEITIEKNIVSKYFTNTVPPADLVERDGTKIKYTWIREISPGEKFTIQTTTNWVYPIIIFLLIIWVVVFIGKFLSTDVTIKKKASYLRTKGGEFALKVTIQVKAQKEIERLNLIERLPGVVNVYPKFAGESPSRVNEEKRRIDWRFEKMEAGEIRRISYILYSKVGIMGRLALPRSKVVYERQGKIKRGYSNKCFFISGSN